MYKRLIKSLVYLFLAILVFMSLRWGFYEPYVIPSGSMIPTLLINDHIIVKKNAYGWRIPFTSSWFTEITSPKRGDVVVFRSIEDPGFFMIKRVVGVAGDKLKIDEKGHILVNEEPEISFSKLIYDKDTIRRPLDFEISEGHIFVMGDNRDNSHDSRYWGELPIENLLGKASIVWLSCEEILESGLCQASTIRWKRLLSEID